MKSILQFLHDLIRIIPFLLQWFNKTKNKIKEEIDKTKVEESDKEIKKQIEKNKIDEINDDLG